MMPMLGLGRQAGRQADRAGKAAGQAGRQVQDTPVSVL
jgi:hypothetical protein